LAWSFVDGPIEPNTEYLLGLSQSQIRAYMRDMSGETDENGEPVPTVPGAQLPCRGAAQQAVFGLTGIDDPTIPYEFGRVYRTDPLIVAAVKSWRECMLAIDATFLWPWPDDVYLGLLVDLEDPQGHKLVDLDGQPIEPES
jgi:hypothetical protein